MSKPYVVKIVTNWNDKEHRSISAIVIKHSKNNSISNKGNSAALTRVMRAMGFKTVIEYAKSYPGRFMIESEIGKLMESYSRNALEESCFKNEKRVVNLTIEPMYDQYYVQNIMIGNNHLDLFMSPRVEQIMGCRKFKNVSNECLWFCSDWVG